MNRRIVLLIAVVGLAAPTSQSALGAGRRAAAGAVFVATNSPDSIRGNEIVMYSRARDGTLTLQGRFPTGGLGSGPGTLFRGDALAAQGSLSTTGDGDCLLQW